MKNTAPSKTPEDPRPQMSLVLRVCLDQGKCKPIPTSLQPLSKSQFHHRPQQSRSGQGQLPGESYVLCWDTEGPCGEKGHVTIIHSSRGPPQLHRQARKLCTSIAHVGSSGGAAPGPGKSKDNSVLRCSSDDNELAKHAKQSLKNAGWINKAAWKTLAGWLFWTPPGLRSPLPPQMRERLA